MIPLFVVILSFMVAPPVGIVLGIIKLLQYLSTQDSSSSSATGRTSNPYRRTSSYNSDPNRIYVDAVDKTPSSSGTASNRTYASGSTANSANTAGAGGSVRPGGTYTYNGQTFGKTRPSSYTGSASEAKKTQDARSSSSDIKKEEKKAKKQKKSVGYILTLVFGIITAFIATVSIPAAIEAGFPAVFTHLLTTTLPFALVSGGLFTGSYFFRNRDVRRARIKAIIGNRESINISKLAAASDTTIKKVKKDLQALIDAGEFGESAYIDLGTNNFMRTPNATPDDPAKFDYTKLYGDTFKKKGKKDQTDGTDTQEPASDRDNFNTIIQQIRDVNDEIKDVEVSERIFKIEAQTKTIFDYVTDHPEAMPQIRTFLNYYLPTTLKLLDSYSRIEKVGVAGENMKKSKENIEQMLDLLVVGFEKQIDLLFKNEYIDISSDVSVLEAMMRKDGLSSKEGTDIASMLQNMNSVPAGDEGNPQADAAVQAAEDLLNSYSDEITDDISDMGPAAAAQAPDKK